MKKMALVTKRANVILDKKEVEVDDDSGLGFSGSGFSGSGS